MSGQQTVTIPDDQAFASFKAECLGEDGWIDTYNKRGITVWSQEVDNSVHKIKCRMVCKDVSADTAYDVLHDIEYRRKWDTNVIETFDIGRLTVNADVGYYSWKCPKPLRNRDVVTLRSWLPIGKDYIIMNYSVKHDKYPPKQDVVRAVSVQTGYLIQFQGPNNCILTYLAQIDPRGSLPKWVVKISSASLLLVYDPHASIVATYSSGQGLALAARQVCGPVHNKLHGPLRPLEILATDKDRPGTPHNSYTMKKIHKACLKYSEWKQKHNPGFKPWLYPEQTTLPSIPLSELSLQRAESLEKIDESSLVEIQVEGEDSD